VALGDSKIIDLGDLPPTIASASPSPDTGTVTLTGAISSTDLEDIERATIERVFEQVKGDKAMAGKMLGISRATLYRKLKRYNIGSRQDLGSSSQSLQ
jgi:transcriptional regulator of acetoin/glycerol metabolism